MIDRCLGHWTVWMVIFGLIFGAALFLSIPSGSCEYRGVTAGVGR